MFQTLMAHFDQHYLKKYFCVKKKENEMTILYEKLALSYAFFSIISFWIVVF